MTADPFAALRQKFLDRCEADLEILRDIAADGGLAPVELRRVAHRLAGAAGTFGFGALGEPAQRIDAAFADGREADRADLDALIAIMSAVLARRVD